MYLQDGKLHVWAVEDSDGCTGELTDDYAEAKREAADENGKLLELTFVFDDVRND